jgi:hypothetical protein
MVIRVLLPMYSECDVKTLMIRPGGSQRRNQSKLTHSLPLTGGLYFVGSRRDLAISCGENVD